MNFKKLTVAAAIVAMTSLGAVAPALAQAPAPAAPAAAPAAPAPDAAAPAAAPAGDAAANKPGGNPADTSTPYGLQHMWETGGWISRTILGVLVIMSAGTWYIFFTKWIEQQRILGQASQVEKKFWTSATLNEGVDKLPKKDPGKHDFNDAGKWLMAEKEKRGAKRADGAWLKDYTPAK